jgi:hypothetical protein
VRPRDALAWNRLSGGAVRYVEGRAGRPWQRVAHMKKLALIAALLLAASPVAAQSEQPLGAGGQTNTSTLPNTGVICEEEMTATFCNVPTAPSNGGYGSGAVSGSSAASSSGGGSSAPPSPSIPTCSEFPPANELCN